ncbi:hypothetical protein N5W20_04355 [Candidatus Kirkpatrickella diaphorinae]|uniref:Uncharacterized protein n=1 Tax=Candidatus Kirkpatrickella diaphorinae TaxID=2984322 RepID=A0ABY6GKN1_9PROT|nr:hypothetical protein [Candidatus Kirkpatrickella diaphorinae]UYH52091.1 hypothetical protein N5W20_04355 [Candidatus Kirkpatrickella diaphorinae]
MGAVCKYKLISPATNGEIEDLLHEKSPDDGLRRVQALLTDWLRLENLVVLTAAGTSLSAGGRLMARNPENNLECKVLDAVEQCSLAEDTMAIIHHRKSLWPKDKEQGPSGFEEWLSYLFNAAELSAPERSPIRATNWKGIENSDAAPDLRKF